VAEEWGRSEPVLVVREAAEIPRTGNATGVERPLFFVFVSRNECATTVCVALHDVARRTERSRDAGTSVKPFAFWWTDVCSIYCLASNGARWGARDTEARPPQHNSLRFSGHSRELRMLGQRADTGPSRNQRQTGNSEENGLKCERPCRLHSAHRVND
jgi:hypothetical protein